MPFIDDVSCSLARTWIPFQPPTPSTGRGAILCCLSQVFWLSPLDLLPMEGSSLKVIPWTIPSCGDYVPTEVPHTIAPIEINQESAPCAGQVRHFIVIPRTKEQFNVILGTKRCCSF